MRIKTIAIQNLNPAPYNPRIDLKPGNPEYERLKRSVDEFGCVEPLVWNERSGNLVGGHQRFKVLLARGDTETDVSVVDLSPEKEKALNIALNKISGDWDVHRRAGQVLTCWDLARHYDVKDTDGRQPHWDEHIDAAVDEIIDRASPSPEDISLLTIRKSQLDFDDARAAQRARIETFLKQHGGPGRLDPDALD